MKNIIQTILAATLVAAVVTVPVSLPGFDGAIAHADDYDDGGDDDDGDDDDDVDDDDDGAATSVGSGSISSGPSPRQLQSAPKPKAEQQGARRPAPTAARQPAPVIRPVQAPAQVIAIGLADDQLSALQGNGYTVLSRSALSAGSVSVIRLGVPQGTNLEDARAAVRAANPAAAADFNHYYRPGAAPEGTACTGNHCADRSLIGWPEPNALPAACKRPIRIGLVDTGINAAHEALVDADLQFVQNDRSGLAAPSDRQHGTAVAALLVGSPSSRTPGLLPWASVTAADPFETVNGDERTDVYSLVLAIDAVAKAGVDVINLSLAGPDNAVLESLIGQIISTRTVVVAAAGNAGPASEPLYPAAYDDVIAVTGVDRALNPYRRAVRGGHIDFAAPGVDVWAAASIRGARTKTGTSFAAPFVAAAAGLLRSLEPDSTPEAIAKRLADLSEDLGEAGRDDIFGHGLIKVAAICDASAVFAVSGE